MWAKSHGQFPLSAMSRTISASRPVADRDRQRARVSPTHPVGNRRKSMDGARGEQGRPCFGPVPIASRTRSGHPDFTNVRYVVAGGAFLLISPHELSGERRINLALVEERCVHIIGQCVAQALADAIRQESGGRVLGSWESRRGR